MMRDSRFALVAAACLILGSAGTASAQSVDFTTYAPRPNAPGQNPDGKVHYAGSASWAVGFSAALTLNVMENGGGLVYQFPVMTQPIINPPPGDSGLYVRDGAKPGGERCRSQQDVQGLDHNETQLFYRDTVCVIDVV